MRESLRAACFVGAIALCTVAGCDAGQLKGRPAEAGAKDRGAPEPDQRRPIGDLGAEDARPADLGSAADLGATDAPPVDAASPADGAPADLGAADAPPADGTQADFGAADALPADTASPADQALPDDQALPADTAAPQWTLVWSDEFNGTALDTTSWDYYTGPENHSQSYYRTANVSVAGGELRILTQRHCTAAAGDALSAANASTAPCPAGEITRYSSGYVRSTLRWNAGRIEVRAKLPQLAIGVWPAIWLRNQTSWCGGNYGEIDVLEAYGDDPHRTTATTHVTCAADQTLKVQHYRDEAARLDGDYHTWAAEWGPAGVTYFLDGTVVPKNKPYASGQHTDVLQDFAGVTGAVWQAVFGESWQVRLNTQIVNAGDAWHAAPDDALPFPPVTYLVDSVKVFAATQP